MEEDKNKPKSPFKEGGMFNEAHPLVFANAKALRKNMTEAEKVLWGYLKSGVNGLKIRRQHAIGIYIADFYCHPVKLVIELDGESHFWQDGIEKDKIKEEYLKSIGVKVVRFENKWVFEDVNWVLEKIKAEFNHP